MLPRNIAAAGLDSLLEKRLGSYPAVALVGSRQCGKTTLARSLGGRYYDMEQETDQLRIDLEWDEVARADELVVIDEAQAAPQIFPRLRPTPQWAFPAARIDFACSDEECFRVARRTSQYRGTVPVVIDRVARFGSQPAVAVRWVSRRRGAGRA